MTTRQLFLTSTATSSPYPTTSRLFSESANAVEVQLGPGEFDNGIPGTADAGQWNPSSAIADTTAAAEIDSTGASPGTARQGWLFNTDLTGLVLARGAWTIQLRLRANQGTGTTGFICARVSIVTGAAGAWTTVKQIFVTTRVTGSASLTAGQAGWRDQNNAALTVTSTAGNFSVTIGADDATTQGHTFTSGQRILVELGFCNADSATDRTWRLDYNTSNAFVTTPDIAVPARTGTAAESHAVQAEAGAGGPRVGVTSASVSDAHTEAVAGGVRVGVTSASSGAAQTEATAGAVVVGVASASTGDAQTDAIDGTVSAGNPDIDGDIAETHSAQTETASLGVVVSAAAGSTNTAQTTSAAAGVVVGVTGAESHAAHGEAASGTVVTSATGAEANAVQTESIVASARASASSAEVRSVQASQGAGAVAVSGTLAEAHSAQSDALTGGTPVAEILATVAEVSAAHTAASTGTVTVGAVSGEAVAMQQGAGAVAVRITAVATSAHAPHAEAIRDGDDDSYDGSVEAIVRTRGRHARASRHRR